jgi:hypothetical protein
MITGLSSLDNRAHMYVLDQGRKLFGYINCSVAHKVYPAASITQLSCTALHYP